MHEKATLLFLACIYLHHRGRYLSGSSPVRQMIQRAFKLDSEWPCHNSSMEEYLGSHYAINKVNCMLRLPGTSVQPVLYESMYMHNLREMVLLDVENQSSPCSQILPVHRLSLQKNSIYVILQL